MQITDIRVRRTQGSGKMKAIVSVTFDDMFVVHDIKVIDSMSGLFVAMPSRKTATGEHKDVAHPINAEARETVQTAILNEYLKVIEQEENDSESEKNSI